MAKMQQKVSAFCVNQTHDAQFTAICSNHWALGTKAWYLLILYKKKGLWFVKACNLEWMSQVQYQGQTRYIRILDSNPLINTYYSIGHRLELKFFYLHIFAKYQRSLGRSSTSKLARTENLQFGIDLQDLAMDGWSVTVTDQQWLTIQLNTVDDCFQISVADC